MRTLTRDVFEVDLDLDEPAELSFEAGQWVSVPFGPKNVRAYSIASTPRSSRRITLCADVAPGGIGSAWFRGLTVGQAVEFKAPFCGFVFRRDDPRRPLFVAEEIGIVPIRSILTELHETGSDRPATLVYWARRGVDSMRTPGFAHDGPKAMLINGYSSSGGDALPYLFRKNRLGPLVGTRTWGGLIGLSGNPALLDGGSVLIPSFRIYDDGRYVVENEGVSPDVEVIDLPEARIAGGDPSLEKAVQLLLAELEKHPADLPAAPKPPRVKP